MRETEEKEGSARKKGVPSAAVGPVESVRSNKYAAVLRSPGITTTGAWNQLGEGGQLSESVRTVGSSLYRFVLSYPLPLTYSAVVLNHFYALLGPTS